MGSFTKAMWKGITRRLKKVATRCIHEAALSARQKSPFQRLPKGRALAYSATPTQVSSGRSRNFEDMPLPQPMYVQSDLEEPHDEWTDDALT